MYHDDNVYYCGDHVPDHLHPETMPPAIPVSDVRNASAQEDDIESQAEGRPCMFSEEGAVQMVADAQEIKKSPAYHRNVMAMRAFAVQCIQANAKRCMVYVTGNEMAMCAVRDALGEEDAQEAVLASHLQDLARREWGTDLTLVMLALCVPARVHVFLEDSEREHLVPHPAIATVGPEDATYEVIMVHNEKQTHWSAGVWDTVDNRATLGNHGVTVNTSSGQPVLVIDQPQDGHCQFSSFFFGLSQTQFDMNLIFCTNDSDVLPSGESKDNHDSPPADESPRHKSSPSELDPASNTGDVTPEVSDG